jgi:polysaccharide chain length determinant protein (PEP-CTERM system associated)
MLAIYLRELFVRRRVVALMICIILITSGNFIYAVHSLSSYESITTIYVAEKTIISPLMEGTAVSGSVSDQAESAKELIFSPKIMNQLLDQSGLADKDVTPIGRERIMDRMKERMDIDNLGSTMIRISYNDKVPARAQSVAARAAELFVQEGTQARSEQSEEAFHFIEDQTKDYLEKLTRAEQEIKEFRTANFNARVGTESEVNARIDQLNKDIEATRTALAEAIVKRDSLQSQLNGESENLVVATQESTDRKKIAELESQIETLRMSYQDAHPEVVRIKYQINDLKEDLQRMQEARKHPKTPGSPPDSVTIIDSPVFLQMKTDMIRENTEIASLGKRLQEYQNQLATTMFRGRALSAGDARLAEITRNYDINRELYNDLLRRRENARLSMNLGRTEQGPALKIQDPASLPLQPTGLRLLHILIGSALLTFLLPGLYVAAQLKFDSRIRDPKALSDFSGVPVLSVLPSVITATRVRQVQAEIGGLVAAVGISGIVFVALIIARIYRTY